MSKSKWNLDSGDYSRYTVVFLIHNKDQALDAFKQYKANVELQTKFKIKCIRTDGVLEYLNKDFNKLISDAGMNKHTTCPHSPQQNARAERLNRTLITMAIMFLNTSNLSTNLWPAIQYAAYIKNRLPHSSIENQILYILFHNKEPNYNIRRTNCIHKSFSRK